MAVFVMVFVIVYGLKRTGPWFPAGVLSVYLLLGEDMLHYIFLYFADITPLRRFILKRIYINMARPEFQSL